MDINPQHERLYNVRAAVPGHLDVFSNWRQWSNAYTTERPDARLDIAYGNGAGETLDFFPALSGGKDVPLVVLIHGGYWQAMDKKDNRFAARALCEQGVAVAVVNHTLCPAVALDGIVDEIRRASLWLWRNEQAFPFSRKHMIVIGHSAGGHLAAMMLCTDWKSFDHLAAKQLFSAGVFISGLFDLSPLVKTTINEKVGLTCETAQQLSPVHCAPHGNPAVFAVVGGDESTGFHEQAQSLRTSWSAHGVEVKCGVLPECNHFQAFEHLTSAKTHLFSSVMKLLKS